MPLDDFGHASSSLFLAREHYDAFISLAVRSASAADRAYSLRAWKVREYLLTTEMHQRFAG